MAVITLTEAKLLLQITDTSKDALITALIPIIESDIREYCNADFQDAPTEPSWSAWMKLPASQMIGYQLDPNSTGLKSESQGGYSYTKQDLIAGYPSNVMQSLNKARFANVGSQSIKSQYRDTRGWNAEELVKYTPVEGIDE